VSQAHSDPQLATRPVGARYDALAASGTIERDPAQAALAARLDALARALHDRRMVLHHERPPSKTAFGWLFGRRELPPAPRGLYVWGSVGRGKTMLMDLFFEGIAVRRKRRAHFHAYMAEAHERIHDWRQKLKRGAVQGDDPIRPVAAALAEEAWVLCFDEFAVTDIADAMILGRLFTALFEHGVVVVATSNVEPDRLYEGGLNRALFLPFIKLLKERMEVATLDARTDYRLEKLEGHPVYFTPADEAARRALDEIFSSLTAGARPKPMTLTVHGHEIVAPAQAMGAARFSYADLCQKPLGAADYIALGRAFHTIVLEDMPVIPSARRDEARRFITLVDVLYERHVKLVMSAEAEPQGLYHAETGNEAFAFDRTVSRLIEMRSHEYLARPREAAQPAPGDANWLVET
jgi:cell division protein ZapE